jgi:DNA-binding Xre family transcriptional regulator
MAVTTEALFDIWKEREKELGRIITVTEVAEAIGHSRYAVAKLRDGKSGRVDLSLVNGVCRFFDIPAGPVPFIVYNPPSDKST